MRDKHHVLIVNGKPQIAASWEQALERSGYHVSCVERGGGALERLANERIDAVIVDTALADMAGITLAQAVRHGRPSAGVLLLTDGELAARFHLQGDAGLIVCAKPITTRLLRKYLEQLLQATSTAEPQSPHHFRSPSSRSMPRVSPASG